MRIILEQIDNDFYGDLIMTPEEAEQMAMGEMIEDCTICNKQKYYLGVRLQNSWSETYEEESWWDETRS